MKQQTLAMATGQNARYEQYRRPARVKGVLQGKPKSVALLVQRDGEKIFVPVNLG